MRCSLLPRGTDTVNAEHELDAKQTRIMQLGSVKSKAALAS